MQPEAPPNTPLLPLRFERVGYRSRSTSLLEELSFSLDAGPVSVILGPNGAGKTLALRIANGLIAPSSGVVSWNGGTERARAESTLVFQRPVLLRRSARANIEYALRLRGMARKECRSRAEVALGALGLSKLGDRPARLLSGGEQHRLALARARALAPTVLFLDEPAASLDPGATRALETSITNLRDAGTKIIMTTHDLEQARRMADEILFFHRGRLLEHASAEAFFGDPKCIEAKKFLARELTS